MRPKERGISFSALLADMVHAGVKTQTRRPVTGDHPPIYFKHPREKKGQGWRWYEKARGGGGWPEKGRWCPYGRSGQLLWVREPFWQDEKTHQVVAYHGQMIPGSSCPGAKLLRPTMMSRLQCRTLLQVTEVRMEKVSEISSGDALAEGFKDVEEFQAAFEGIYGKDDPSPWAGDPWVWVVTFKVLTRSGVHE